MKDKHYIDELFKEGTQHDFPFDETLWEQAEISLDAKSGKKKKVLLWSWASLLLFTSIALYLLLPFKPQDLEIKNKNEEFNTNSQAINQNDSQLKYTNKELPVAENTGMNPQSSGNAIEKRENPGSITPESIPDEKQGSEKRNEKEPGREIQTIITTHKPTNPRNDKRDIVPTFPAGDGHERSDFSDEANALLNPEFPSKSPLERVWENRSMQSKKSSFNTIIALGKPQVPVDTGLKEKTFVHHLMNSSFYAQFNILPYSFGRNRSLSGLSDEIRAYRNSNESFQSAENTELILVYQHKKPRIGIGIGSLSIQESAQYPITLNYQIFESADTSYAYLRDTSINNKTIGLYLETIDSNFRDSSSSTVVSRNMRYRYWTIPVSISYPVQYRRFEIAPELGMKFMFLRSADGSYLNSATDSEQAVSGEAASFAMMYQLGLQLAYRVSKPLSVGLKCGFNGSLRSHQTNYDQQFRYQNLGFFARFQLY